MVACGCFFISYNISVILFNEIKNALSMTLISQLYFLMSLECMIIGFNISLKYNCYMFNEFDIKIYNKVCSN